MSQSAASAKPTSAASLYEELLAPLNAGYPEKTLRLVEPYLQSSAGNSEIWFIHGMALKNMGEHNKAIASLARTLELRPEHWKALFELATLMEFHGQNEQAEGLYHSVLTHNPLHLNTHLNLGELYARQGRNDLALRQAVEGVLHHQDVSELWTRIMCLMSSAPSIDVPVAFIDLVNEKAKTAKQSEYAFANVAFMCLIQFYPELQSLLQKAHQTGGKSVSEAPLPLFVGGVCVPLFQRLLERMLVNQMDFEYLARSLRYTIMQSVPQVSEEDAAQTLQNGSFLSAMARYFFRTEYVADQTAEETQWLTTCISMLNSQASGEAGISAREQLALFAVALYQPLHALTSIDAWDARATSARPELEALFDVHVRAIKQERKLQESIPRLTPISDSVSVKVQEQYEENPYPRWDSFGASMPMNSATFLLSIIPYPLPASVTLPEKPEILIAGCGTGRHSIMMSDCLPSATLLNVDLSRASLAYALHKCREYGLESRNEFLQADILDLAQLNRQFDMVDSSGVLHHMQDPMAGWRVLTDILKPGGLMKIGLYSRTARREIIRVRDEISQSGLGDSIEEMRQWRAAALSDPRNQFIQSPDFYTRSTLRDLIFHRQEKQFTLPEIKTCLAELGLRFLGFSSDRETYQAFQQTFPKSEEFTNLDRWAEVEEKYPSLFFRMYQFWCDKPA